MSIKGGWDTTLWYGAAPTPVNLGVVTRPDPNLDPALINVRGTGKRGLRDIILGLKDFRVSVEWAPASVSFITSFQAGAEIAALHYKVAALGLTFKPAYVERLTVSCRAGDYLRCSGEIVAKEVVTLEAFSGTEVDTVLDWTNFQIRVAPKSAPTVPATVSDWHEWRYEVRNNFERLPNVDAKTTRSLVQRHREVTGLLVRDLNDYAEWLEFVGGDAEKKFYIQVKQGANYLLGSASGIYSQWGRLEAPHGPEDLQLKRFPFTCIDLYS